MKVRMKVTTLPRPRVSNACQSQACKQNDSLSGSAPLSPEPVMHLGTFSEGYDATQAATSRAWYGRILPRVKWFVEFAIAQ